MRIVSPGHRNRRDDCLRLLVEQLGPTRPGRELGLDAVRSLDDFRASIPIRDRTRHQEEVTSRFGFGLDDDFENPGGWERDVPVGIWGAWLGGAPKRVALLRGRRFDTAVDEILVEDLEALGGELRRIDRWESAASVLEQLEAFEPELLVVPSVLTIGALESVHRAPLERRLPQLELILAEHDLRRTRRTRIPIKSAGWIEAPGRFAVPSTRGADDSVTLAVGTSVIELLPYSNPEEDGQRVYARQTTLPEDAVMGQRYELVVSSPHGFLRLRTGEHVRVVGFDMPYEPADFPRPRVLRLPPAPADVRLEGCTVSGAWLSASIRQALHREDPALVFAEVGPDPLSIPTMGASLRTGSTRLPAAFDDTELAWLTRTGSHRLGKRKRPRGLLLRIEVQGYVVPELVSKLSERIDANLQLRSPAYAHLRTRAELDPPRVMVVPAGTRGRDEQRRVEALGGVVRHPDVRIVEPTRL
ncbi:MAG: GH3 auxin-responsive promoter family protein [Nannocystaceae bacterium]|nr:GH3 auxin-responsive promoter family protein [bacterium]